TIDGTGGATPGDLGEVSSAIEGLRSDLNQRMTELDVHLMRMDGVVAGLEKRLELLHKRAGGDARPLFLLLFVLVGFAAGALMAVAVLR
ncbi:hypothetical protein KC221_23240, partial [Mycobacterium tuberculosis]|nr:hypothetical protein [Mycobacterium tuberculosis]